MADKKISFGFNKLKKPVILPGLSQTKKETIELIQCLEGQTIKIVGEENKVETPLIIPLLSNTKTSSALAALRVLKDTLEGKEDLIEENKTIDPLPDANGTLEQRAAREIINSLQECQNLNDTTNNVFSLPLTADQLPLDGASESTLDDYEQIPISQFGLAILRGMGWKDEVKNKKDIKIDGPTVRPKGMGLGADKMIKPMTPLVAPAVDEVLSIKKNACVRILLGKHRDLYGQIEGLDDHAGRVLVKLALGSVCEWFNEFMVQPVSKQEYAQYAKVINSAKYDEYKNKQEEEKIKQEYIKKEKVEPSSNNYRQKSGESKNNHSDSQEFVSDYENYKQISRATGSRRRSPSPDRNKKYLNHTDDDNYSQSSIKQHEKMSRHNSSSSEEVRSTSHHCSKHESYRRENRKNKSSDEYSSVRKKSHHKKSKSKKCKSRSRSREYQKYSTASDEEKHHKKKTKKSKRPRSRSRNRR